MMMMFAVLAIVGTIGLFYKAGELEDSNTFGGHRAAVWAGASVALWAATFFLLHWGPLSGLLLQAGLLGFLTVWGAVKMQRGTRNAAKRSADRRP